MNLFENYLKDPLYEVVVKILTSTSLFEMAYERKVALEAIYSHATQLVKIMVMVHHAVDSRDLPHWKTTINSHIREIHELTYLKGKKRMSASDIREHVLEGPFGEYNDYRLTHHDVSESKSGTMFSPHTEDDYAAIRRKYDRLIPLLLKNDIPPKYDDLLDS